MSKRASKVLSDEERKSVVISCSCGCKNSMVIEPVDDSSEVSISFLADTFYAEQTTFVSRLVKKLKRIVAVIRGKEYSLFDIVVNADDFHRFREIINDIDKSL